MWRESHRFLSSGSSALTRNLWGLISQELLLWVPQGKLLELLPPPPTPGHLLNLRCVQPDAIFTGVCAVGWVLPKAQTHRQARRLAKCVFLSLFILNGPGPMYLGFFFKPFQHTPVFSSVGTAGWTTGATGGDKGWAASCILGEGSVKPGGDIWGPGVTL